MNFTQQIAENLDNPAELERLFRENPEAFQVAFESVFVGNPDAIVVEAWHERLHFQPVQSNQSRLIFADSILILILCLLAGTIAKLPAYFPQLAANWFYPTTLRTNLGGDNAIVKESWIVGVGFNQSWLQAIVRTIF